MTVWILIIYFTVGYGGGVATAVMHSQKACESVVNYMNSAKEGPAGHAISWWTFCAEK